MKPNPGPRFRAYATRNSPFFFGAILFVLITLLLGDRYFFQKLKNSSLTLGDFLNTHRESRLLSGLDPSAPHLGFTPRALKNRSECGDSIGASDRIAAAMFFQGGVPPGPGLIQDLVLLNRTLDTEYETLPATLSKAFSQLQRFIHSRKGFDQVEETLRLLIPKFDVNAESTLMPPSLIADLDDAWVKIRGVQCSWHQPNPMTSSWAFDPAPATNSGKSADESYESLFPPRANQKIVELQVQKYMQMIEVSSAFPLWVQKEKPRDQIMNGFRVLERPLLINLQWIKASQELSGRLSQFVNSLTSKSAKLEKTVAWQLRNLTQTMDQAAKHTPPDANAIFAEIIVPLNDRLTSLGDAKNPRWEKLAQELLKSDLKIVENMQKILAHPTMTLAKDTGSALQAEWARHWDTYFGQFGYWVYPKGALAPPARLGIIMNEYAQNPRIQMSPETPWLYWWVKGRPLLYSSHFFFWRQLLLGVAVGMTLLLWTFKKVFFS